MVDCLCCSELCARLLWPDGSEQPSGSLSAVDSCMYKYLRQLLKQNKHADEPTLDTIIRTIGRLARASSGDFWHHMLSLLLVVALELSQRPAAVAIAMTEVAELAAQRGVSVSDMVEGSGRLAVLLAEHVYEAQRGRLRTSPAEVLNTLVTCLHYDSVQQLATHYGPLLLPDLVSKADSSASRVIRLLAQHMDTTSSSLLHTHAAAIFCHLVLHCDRAQYENGLRFLFAECADDNLLHSCSFAIITELLLYLGDRGKEVIMALRDVQGEGDAADTVEWLRPKLLGIIIRFDNFLRDTSVKDVKVKAAQKKDTKVKGVEEKKRAYASLIALMKLMGARNVTAVRVHLMTTLRLGHKYLDCGFADLCCEAWQCYIDCMESSALGSMLAPLTACLLNLLPCAETAVYGILSHLITDRAADLRDHLDELCFLPDHLALADLHSVLRSHFTRNNTQDVRSQICLLVSAVNGDCAEVRQLALGKVKSLLNVHQVDLHRRFLDNDAVDDVVCQLASALLARCHDADVTTRRLCGECLGLLGALDPARLEMLNSVQRDTLRPSAMNIGSDEFAFNILSELVKALLRATDRATQVKLGLG